MTWISSDRLLRRQRERERIIVGEEGKNRLKGRKERRTFLMNEKDDDISSTRLMYQKENGLRKKVKVETEREAEGKKREKGVRKEERKKTFIYISRRKREKMGTQHIFPRTLFPLESYFLILSSLVLRFSEGAKSRMIWKCGNQESESL